MKHLLAFLDPLQLLSCCLHTTGAVIHLHGACHVLSRRLRQPPAILPLISELLSLRFGVTSVISFDS